MNMYLDEKQHPYIKVLLLVTSILNVIASLHG